VQVNDALSKAIALPRPAIEVADILRVYGEEYRHSHPLSPLQRRVMRDIEICRTASLGGHVDVCEHGCGYQRISYNSCRNRHCPKCQGLRSAQWLTKMRAKILPTHYFHTIFTVPKSSIQSSSKTAESSTTSSSVPQLNLCSSSHWTGNISGLRWDSQPFSMPGIRKCSSIPISTSWSQVAASIRPTPDGFPHETTSLYRCALCQRNSPASFSTGFCKCPKMLISGHVRLGFRTQARPVCATRV